MKYSFIKKNSITKKHLKKEDLLQELRKIMKESLIDRIISEFSLLLFQQEFVDNNDNFSSTIDPAVELALKIAIERKKIGHTFNTTELAKQYLDFIRKESKK